MFLHITVSLDLLSKLNITLSCENATMTSALLKVCSDKLPTFLQ